mgnify:FL=1
MENFGRRKPESRETVLLYNFGGCVGITVLTPPPQTPGCSSDAGCRGGSGVLVHYITTAPKRNEMRPLDGRTV